METEIEKETRRKIKKSVKNIMEGGKANLYELSEKSVREKASADLNLDLNLPSYKTIVRRYVEEFLIKAKSNPQKLRKKTSKM